MFYVRDNAKNLSDAFMDIYRIHYSMKINPETGKNYPPNPYTSSLRTDHYFNDDPMYFKTEQEFMEFIS